MFCISVPAVETDVGVVSSYKKTSGLANDKSSSRAQEAVVTLQ